MTHYPILAILPTPSPPPSTPFHPRSPNTPKDQQRVTLCRLFKTFDPGSPACTILARWGGRSPNTAPDAVFRVVGWNAPKDRQRVTTLKCQNPASQPGFSSFDSRVAQPPSAVLYLRGNRHSLLPVQLSLCCHSATNKIRNYISTILPSRNKKICDPLPDKDRNCVFDTVRQIWISSPGECISRVDVSRGTHPIP
jgi:hypothetical protein